MPTLEETLNGLYLEEQGQKRQEEKEPPEGVILAGKGEERKGKGKGGSCKLKEKHVGWRKRRRRGGKKDWWGEYRRTPEQGNGWS